MAEDLIALPPAICTECYALVDRVNYERHLERHGSEADDETSTRERLEDLGRRIEHANRAAAAGDQDLRWQMRQLGGVPGVAAQLAAEPRGLDCPHCGGLSFELQLGGRRHGNITCRTCGWSTST